MIHLPNFNEYIKNQAKVSGFVLCGVSVAENVDEKEQLFLQKWIEEGRNADMDWFKRNEKLRVNPSVLVEGAKTVVSFAHAYQPIRGNNVAAYANDIDYHFILKEKLNQIVERINLDYGVEVVARVFSDSAPLMERYWAVKGGLGWIGKSGMLINKQYGSYLLLCEIVLDVVSDVYDTAESFDGCATCRRCIKSCPTDAIGSDRSIDARRCVSYLTIEHRGEFSDEQKALLSGEWVYGCDCCMLCCPWNAKKIFATPTITIDNRILNMSGSEFRAEYKNTPLERTGLKNIRRNYVG